MVGSLRMPASGGSRNGKRQLLAATSGKKSTPARTPSGAPLAQRRLAPVETRYSSPKKRQRPGDLDGLLANDNLPSRPQQKPRNNVSTPSSIAAAARANAAAQLPLRSTPLHTALPHEMQVRPPQKPYGNGSITPFKTKSNYRSKTLSTNNWGFNNSSYTRQPYWGSLGGGSLPSNAPAGLVNLGNTCYLNAVLQSLFSLPTFPGAINAAVALGGNALPSDGVLKALATCLADRNASSAAGRSAFSPEQVKLAVGRRLGAFRGSFQQDAHEFFCGLLEAVQAEVLAIEAHRHGRRQIHASETTDPSTRVFGFAVEHEITCTECSKVSHVTEQCTHLSLDLPKGVDRRTVVVPPGLDSMLSSYFQEESVEKGCEGCGGECVRHTVRHRIKRLPQILALHVKRFQVTFQQSTGTVTCAKVRDQISISQVLRVKPYCVEENLTMPLPPLKIEQQVQQQVQEQQEPEEQKENFGLNTSLAALSPPRAAPAPAGTLLLEPAIKSNTFYSGSGNAAASAFDDIFSPPQTKPKTFARLRKANQPAKGAAQTSYWDKNTSGTRKVNWAEKASDIISATGVEQGRQRRNYEEEEEADLLAAIEASKKDQEQHNELIKHGSSEEDDEMDADLATALKRSLEEQEFRQEEEQEQQQVPVAEAAEEEKEEKEVEVIDLGEALTPVKNGGGHTSNDDNKQQEEENEDKNKENAMPPPAPLPEIVEDNAKIENEEAEKENTTIGIAKNKAMPLELETRPETVPLAPAVTAKQALATYRLTAVINHHGPSAESGHFTAVTHNATTGQWFRFNDAQVHRIQGDVATNEVAERDSYMLFYTIQS